MSAHSKLELRFLLGRIGLRNRLRDKYYDLYFLNTAI